MLFRSRYYVIARKLSWYFIDIHIIKDIIMYSVRMSEYTPDLVDDDSGLFPDENTTHDFQSAMFTLYSLPTMHCYPIPQATE